jgi:hypothetical protein
VYTPMASEASAVRSQSVASAGQPARQDEYELLAATGRRTRADMYTTACQAGSLLPSTSSTVTAQKARTDTTASSMAQVCQTAP